MRNQIQQKDSTCPHTNIFKKNHQLKPYYSSLPPHLPNMVMRMNVKWEKEFATHKKKKHIKILGDETNTLTLNASRYKFISNKTSNCSKDSCEKFEHIWPASCQPKSMTWHIWWNCIEKILNFIGRPAFNILIA